MPLIAQRIARGLTPFIDPYMTPAKRSRPEKIILGVRSGHRPSDKPPVRIFLGSERKQFRAERAFLWSIEKHRDPGRIYEVHLLKGLKGYISGFWITGFTNYRFAIPYFCDYAGRALYNDVDQVWLTDPAELFDREMNGAGFLSINDHDTSVMLIDCKRMAGAWNREAVLKTTRKRIEARARTADLWGEMPARYNARDAEYEPGESACVHFTTLHTQPWRPFPDWFVYDDNPTGRLWFDLEREADEARFMPVSSTRPSSEWPDVALKLTSRTDGPELTALLGPDDQNIATADHRRIEGLLERVPDGDLAWVLDRLFARSKQLDVVLREPLWIRKDRPRRPLHFWIEQFRQAERAHPGTRWRLDRRVGPTRKIVAGGPTANRPVLLLSGSEAGPVRKAEHLGHALARQTGRDLERFALGPIRSRLWTRLTGRGRLRQEFERAAVIVASGGPASSLARSLAVRCQHPPALVLIGRHAGRVPEHGGVVVSMKHHRLPPHPNRIEMQVGFGHEDRFRPPGSADAWAEWLNAPKRVAMLLGAHPGGTWPAAELGDLAARALDWADRRDARLLVVAMEGGGRTASTLARLLDEKADVFHGEPDAEDHPYGLVLERAGALLVAGSGPGILEDALAASAPVYFWPQRTTAGVWATYAQRVADRAFRPSYNKRGSIRPQQGLTYLCARAVECGWILPPTGLKAWQSTLVDQGLAAWIDDEAVPSVRYRPETDLVARRVADVLRLSDAPDDSAGRHRARQ